MLCGLGVGFNFSPVTHMGPIRRSKTPLWALQWSAAWERCWAVLQTFLSGPQWVGKGGQTLPRKCGQDLLTLGM